MRAATQSCSGITVVSKSRQNPRSSAKEPILQLIRKLESCNLAKKEPPPPLYRQGTKDLTQTNSPRTLPRPRVIIYYILEFQELPFFRILFNGPFCSKCSRNSNISLVKNEWLITTTS